jgi:hypothetical protein
MNMSKKLYLFVLLVFFFMKANYNVYGEDQPRTFKQLSISEQRELFAKRWKALQKMQQQDNNHDELKKTIIEGNQIRVLLTNKGSISTPTAEESNADVVWPKGNLGLGYAYEFGPLVATEVFSAKGDTLHIVDDGFLLEDDGDYDPGTDEPWGWEPKKGFSDPSSNEVATFSDLDRNGDGKPDSWPENWYNPILGRYVWPAFLGDDATTPDEEVYYIMDDFDNAEFPYYPFPDDSTKRGLGLELQVRIFQFNNPLAEDIIFLVYTVTNVSPKNLDKVYLGMFGDPHVGGYADYNDDYADFISPFDPDYLDRPNVSNMLYAYDQDGTGMGGKSTGYFGYRFMESPGIDNDGFDNDNDGLLDESQVNDAGSLIFGPIGRYGDPKLHWSGDEDGDWEVEFDDVGIDGIDETGDYGEGDGKPTQLFYTDLNNNSLFDQGEPYSESRQPGMRFGGGEPNFGFLDIAESDQLGLTSFNALLFGGENRPKNDELMWDKMSTNNQRPGDPPPTIEQEADNVFIYGCGPFSLEPGQSQRFSIALLLGVDLDDLLNNAEISQQVFESDYRFAQAPKKPKLVAVPGDKKVTLYWDTGAEESYDPFVARANPDSMHKGFDFEGYRIYRSRDYSFNDTQTITDSKGIPFLSEPLKMVNGLDAQFDIVNEYRGLSGIEYAGRGVRYNLGQNTGLVHVFVDSNNVTNGVPYFYAVTSYDHGDVNAELAPTECQRVIQRDAVTRLFSFDLNTAMVIPNGPASGYQNPTLNSMDNEITREVGNATGKVWLEFVNPFAVKEKKKYDILFDKFEVDSADTAIGYSVIDLEPRTVTFRARDTIYVNLFNDSPIRKSSVTITDQSGNTVDSSRYRIDYDNARIKGAYQGALPAGDMYSATFLIEPVAGSLAMNSEDKNPVFDGIKILVQNEEVGLDSLSTKGGRSGFTSVETNTNFSDEFTKIGLAPFATSKPYPADFEFRFVNYDTSSDGKLISPADSTIKPAPNFVPVKTPFKIVDVSTGERVPFYIQERVPYVNKRWDWQEAVLLLQPGATQITQTTYQVKFSPPVDTLQSSSGTDSIVAEPVIYPGQGDVFLLFSKKPFDAGDKYSFETRAAEFDQQKAKSALDNVIVVPNPYIAYSRSEIAGVFTGTRDDRKLEFRNLPKKCTIRIYTIVGELVDTIEKNDITNYATWDMLTFESQEIAYGVYIYHIDAPGIGTKIGRFAVIK